MKVYIALLYYWDYTYIFGVYNTLGEAIDHGMAEAKEAKYNLRVLEAVVGGSNVKVVYPHE